MQSSPPGFSAQSLSCSLCPSPGSQLPCCLGTVEVAHAGPWPSCSFQTVLTLPCTSLSGPWLGLWLSFGHLSVLSFSQNAVCQLWPWLHSTLSGNLVLDSTSLGWLISSFPGIVPLDFCLSLLFLPLPLLILVVLSKLIIC